ncbi:MAG: metal-dependent transcriptional regulator [Chloroflexota bacterium]|nr:MAG: metal-dependent transcriptional regulator [Chloroflexota bacterium]
MPKRFSATIEDYLKAIYELTQEQERASTLGLAERMGVTAASATGMIQRLASLDPPLVDYQKHHGVSLTAVGRQTALEIVRHHRLLEAFLQQKLGYTWDEVHAEADRLEHVISEDMEDRISQALGNPSYDPHGDPIPTREFQMPVWSNVRMSDLHTGDNATVQRINDTDPHLLRYLSSIQLTPNSRVTVLDVSPFDGNLHIEISGQRLPVVLGQKITSQIFVVKK